MPKTPPETAFALHEEWANGGERWERVSVTAEECERIPADFLEEERERMGDRWFRQEYCCEFTDADESLFDSDVIRAAITDEVLPLPIRRP